MSANLNEDKAAEVPSGQWSATPENEKPMEEMTLGELLFRVLVDGWRDVNRPLLSPQSL